MTRPGRVRRALTLALVAVTLTACAGAGDGGDDTGGGAPPAGEARPDGDGPATVAPPDGAVDARLASLDDLVSEVEAALADASERSGVPVERIAVASALAVTWSDGSLGCPQPDMMYTQALVPGYLLVLEVDGERVEYHGAAGEAATPCGWPAG